MSIPTTLCSGACPIIGFCFKLPGMSRSGSRERPHRLFFSFDDAFAMAAASARRIMRYGGLKNRVAKPLYE